MKAWKRSIISLAVALCLFAGLIPVPANVASAAVGDTITYDFTKAVTGGSAADVVNFDASENSKTAPWKTVGEGLYAGSTQFNTAQANAQSCGLQIPLSNAKGWFTIRIKVDAPGWYTPTFDVWGIMKGADFSAYISNVVDNAEGVAEDATTLAAKAKTYIADENYLGIINNYGRNAKADGSAWANYAVTTSSVTMRPVKFEQAGWYAFTVKGGTAVTATPRYLHLTKVAEETATADTVITDLNLDSMFADSEKDLIIGDTIDADAVIATSEIVEASTEEETVGENTTTKYSGHSATTKGTYDSLVSATSVSFDGSVGVTGKLSDDKKTITVVADMVSDDAYLNITVERDGGSWTEKIPFTVADTAEVAHTLTYDFTEGTAGGEDRRAYQGTNWSTNSEAEKTRLLTLNGTSSRINNQGIGISILSSAKDQWVTFRIKVDAPGWYTPSFTVWGKDNGGRFSAYIAPVSKAAGSISDIELEALRAEEYCIGHISCDNGYKSVGDYSTVTMRTVYFPTAGEYAFTVNSEAKDVMTSAGYNAENFYMYPTKLELNRIAKDEAAIDSDIFSDTYAYLVENGDTYNLYLFGGIKKLANYSAVGFNVGISAGSASTDCAKESSQSVYRELTVNYTDADGSAQNATISASDFGLDSGYLFYRVIEGIDISVSKSIDVTAYAIDENGNSIYGKSTAITVVPAASAE